MTTSDVVITTIGLVLVGAISALATWLVARRNKSGKIATSEAATLWDEGTKMRVELRDEVTLLRGQLAEALIAITGLNQSIESSRNETEAARAETRQSRRETRQLMDQIELLHGEVQTSNALTIGALADNTETRRILLVPKGERTPVEFEHLASAGERQPEGEHPPIAADELADEDTKVEKDPLE